jgi:hypothetical protein
MPKTPAFVIADAAKLEAEAKHARERYRLYEARPYGPRATDPSYLRELGRVSQLAERRLRRAKPAARRGPYDEGAGRFRRSER